MIAADYLPCMQVLITALASTCSWLKLIANVTYGYTSASFSGRMPNVHLADAIVQVSARDWERHRL